LAILKTALVLAETNATIERNTEGKEGKNIDIELPNIIKKQIGNATLYCGDSNEVLKDIQNVDAVITDPPYGLSFMGKQWDYDVPTQELWERVYQSIKQGGHLLSFFGSRTYHRGVIPIEDAGFDIRDQLMWLYGSGFPKSHNIGKRVEECEGWGTALKPAHEPIVMARKPFKGSVAENVLEHGTGGINVDGCRVGDRVGRFPANVMHDGSDVVQEIFPQTNPSKKTYRGLQHSGRHGGLAQGGKNHKENTNSLRGHEDNGGSASRYFYCAKASKKDRDEGLDKFSVRQTTGGGVGIGDYLEDVNSASGKFGSEKAPSKNNHPTVKPTELMKYLCRLITPKGGVVLDPFMGSGSTGKGALLEGFKFIGIEMDRDYFDIACVRIEATQQNLQGDMFRGNEL